MTNVLINKKTQDILVSRNSPQTIVGEKVRLALDTARIVTGESPSPVTDGIVTVFTVANPYVPGTLEVTRASLRMHPGVDFSETSSTTFTMTVAPDSVEPLIVDYIKI